MPHLLAWGEKRGGGGTLFSIPKPSPFTLTLPKTNLHGAVEVWVQKEKAHNGQGKCVNAKNLTM